jgi:phosphoglycolate phosphatase-like HAD superfamily hydrolase
MWREKGVNWQWDLTQYADKVKIGGGKERMFSLGQDDDFRAVYPVPDSADEWWEIVTGWHKRKSEIYKEMIAAGAIPGRPGVKRLAEAALAQGWVLAVCSVFAGDMVKAKKPAPDVYNLAVEKLNLNPADCVVVEDSRNGLLAAVAAGMTGVVTFNPLTQHEDFSEAAIVLSCLGDPGGEQTVVVQNRTEANPAGFFSVNDLEKVLTSRKV